jgi:putative sugar O-methyltransferase
LREVAAILQMSKGPGFIPTSNEKWQLARQTIASGVSPFDLENFKASAANFKIALWDPKTNGLRLLKTLIFDTVSRFSDEDIGRLESISNRSLGNPIDIKDRGVRVCLDYAQAFLETKFIEDVCTLRGLQVLEIGGGYGRTCHTLLSLHEDIERYVIADLSWMLQIAEMYLKRVMSPSQMAKVEFVPLEQFAGLSARNFDLAINIDGFNEFDEAVVKGYLDYINLHARRFYTKNPVAKYRDPSLDSGAGNNREMKYAITSGLLRNVIDIFDGDAIAANVPDFLSAFCPGSRWKCVKHGRGVPWSFYHQALYELQEGN